MHQQSSTATMASDTAADALAPAAAHAAPVTSAILSFVDRYRFYLFAFAALLYLAGFTGVWHPEPDSALYMTIGRNLIQGHGFTYHGQIDELAYPGYPYLLAGIFKVFGTHSLFVPHLAILLMVGLTLLLTYAFFRLHTSRPMAVLVTFNLAIADTFFLHAYQLRNDIPFLLGVMAFLAGYEALVRRGRKLPPVFSALANPLAPWLLMCAGLAFAVAMRPTMFALVGAIIVASLWSLANGPFRTRYVFAVLVAAAAILVAFYLLDPRHAGAAGGGQYEQIGLKWAQTPGRFVGRMLSPRTVELFSRSTIEAMFGHELGLGVNSVVTLLFLAAGLPLLFRRPLWFCYVLATLLIMLLMAEMEVPHDPTAQGQLVPRHFLGILPFMIYLWWLVTAWLETRLPPKWGVPVAIFLAALAFGPNVVKSCAVAVRQRIYAHQTALGLSETNTIEELGRILHDRVPPTGTVVVPHKKGRQLTFYSQRRVIEATPVLKFDRLAKPVYLLDETEITVQDFVKREHLSRGPALLSVPGRIDWRGKPQPPWTLRLASKPQ